MDFILLKRKTSIRRWRFHLKQRKLNYRIHNPNLVEDTANYLVKILIEANAVKVERAIEAVALRHAGESEYIEREREKLK